MTLEMVSEQQRLIASFVADRCPGLINESDFGSHYAAFGFQRKGELLAGVVFYNYVEWKGRPVDVEIALAAVSPRWCSKRAISQIFYFAFHTLGVKRVSARVARQNKRARRFIEGVGLKLEGKKAKGFDGFQDLMFYGLTKRECKWLGLRPHN